MTRYFGIHTLEGEWHSLLPRYVLLADRIQGKQILDIGCGSGIGSSLLLEMGAESVNAIDHRPEVLELARTKHAKQGLSFHVMFWEELDFPDDSFDMVLCMDPTSPVTDPSLLLEIKRVLRTGGEYICAIERRNIDGLESLLPRYGYSSTGEEIDLVSPGERVPQIGQLDEFFETIVSVVQRPRYSFVFDYAQDDDQHNMRRSSPKIDESGLWLGDNPRPQQGSAEQTDERPGRWISIDDRLCDRDGDPSAVELLFCGDDHMPPPTLREVEMPYRGLVDRLHQLFSDLQVRQHPDQNNSSNQERSEVNQFAEREKTSEFRPPESRNTDDKESIEFGQPSSAHSLSPDSRSSTSIQRTPPGEGWHQVRKQLDQMTQMYQQVRAEMEELFVRTRRELDERDRYIEELVDTVHEWRHQFEQQRPASEHPDNDDLAPEPQSSDFGSAGGDGRADDFDRQATGIFRRREDLPAFDDSEDDNELATTESEAIEADDPDSEAADSTSVAEVDSEAQDLGNEESESSPSTESDDESIEGTEEEDAAQATEGDDKKTTSSTE